MTEFDDIKNLSLPETRDAAKQLLDSVAGDLIGEQSMTEFDDIKNLSLPETRDAAKQLLDSVAGAISTRWARCAKATKSLCSTRGARPRWPRAWMARS